MSLAINKQNKNYWVLMNDVGYFYANKKLFGTSRQGFTIQSLKAGKYINQHSLIYVSFLSYAVSVDGMDDELNFLNLGYQYAFSRRKFTPYVGLELHAGHANWNEDEFLYGIDPLVGVTFELTTKFDMRLEIKQHLTFANDGVPSYLNFNIGIDYNNL